eukprot:CAMPEP_0204208754 /NCGR_PEP_ID=MMETSP0361-20130328/72722_1 /ASSEMBLY_ACC=CAM_ASM_000343 /TAXON_ID=268821 /ORGANISM="Scrippsiella Hangoei, Strain SHTV-5" /LENGTH=38 /DNA_ID= /DNA_START= /DNA_END= /DNA_ORIENTATION=
MLELLSASGHASGDLCAENTTFRRGATRGAVMQDKLGS